MHSVSLLPCKEEPIFRCLKADLHLKFCAVYSRAELHMAQNPISTSPCNMYPFYHMTSQRNNDNVLLEEAPAVPSVDTMYSTICTVQLFRVVH
jgi:hypothetical protein